MRTPEAQEHLAKEKQLAAAALRWVRNGVRVGQWQHGGLLYYSAGRGGAEWATAGASHGYLVGQR